MGGEKPLSEKFKSFVTRLHSAVRSERPDEDRIHALYQETEDVAKEFNADPWPAAEAVSPLVGGDKVFLLLYTEMAFQAFFKNKNVKATMVDRVGSWRNYAALFTALIEDDDGAQTTEAAAQFGGAELVITGKWAFDIIYEFVYQFQEACQYRASALQSASSEAELEQVLAHRDVWTVDQVFNFLHRLVRVSKVREVLDAARRPEGEQGPPVSYPSKLHYLLGYFALVGLNRLECLLGDFQGALAVAEPIVEDARAANAGGGGLLLSSSLITQVSLYYHIGLSYLMIRKYKEAIRTFVLVLDLYFKHLEQLKQQQRALQQQQQQQGNQQPVQLPKNADDVAAGKLVDKVAAMLLIVQHLCPGQNIPDAVRSYLLSDRMKDRLRQVQSNDVEAIVTLFVVSAPKFISPATDYEAMLAQRSGGAPRPAAASTYGGLQRIVFGEEVRQMLELRKLRDYLKLYSTIGLDKLSAFTGQAPEEIRRELVQYKHKLLQLEAATGSAGAAAEQAALDFHYHLEGDMVYVDDAGEQGSRREVTKQFQYQIRKLENVTRMLKR